MTVREMSVRELCERGTQSGVLLDVRSPEEFAEGHLPGAVNVPLDQLRAAAGRYAGQQVVAVCRSGNRSVIAAQALTAAGTQAWLRAGRPVVQGADRR